MTLFLEESAGKAGCRRHPRSAARKHTQEEPHSSIQVKPNTRPSLRDGRTAYAALSREPNSFWPPSPRRKSPAPRRLARLPHSQELDRSNDGQDHTVLPYARSLTATSSPGLVDVAGRTIGETNSTAPLVRTQSRAHGEQSAPPFTSRARRCRVHRKPGSAIITTRDRPSRVSRDARHIRHFRISINRNIFGRWD